MNNQGFTLIEFIIVMVIMVLLVGIVGTQVIPYIEKAKKAKDIQKFSAYCTDAISAYTTCLSDLDESEVYQIVAEKEASNWKVTVTDSKNNESAMLKKEFLALNQLEPDGPKCISKEGKKITKIIILCKNNQSYAYLTVLGSDNSDDFSVEVK